MDRSRPDSGRDLLGWDDGRGHGQGQGYGMLSALASEV
ncbi:hypothetical protein SAMN05216267_1018160 [Actinacidiphila rubida]|uniref:Uncharacterized protein n=1 Tax=Actinacidiphila rubida TaxID=310780 RepID=A0A1H8ME38_9ACTN|nr:hypothetical protein SAMN05216267_1018160 [Actinacidiphila rubida]